ncbi:MAG: hypothetical protein JWM74_2031 [Myxococcaceae bacterium]|nr:hypothetical protein [Myxococcaceae bacterium]
MMKHFAIRFPHLAAALVVVACAPLALAAGGCYKGDVVSIGHDPLARTPDDAGPDFADPDDAGPDTAPAPTVDCKVDQSGGCHCTLEGVPGYGMKCGGPDGGMQCYCFTYPDGKSGGTSPAVVDIPNGTCATPEGAFAAYRDACGFPVP